MGGSCAVNFSVYGVIVRGFSYKVCCAEYCCLCFVILRKVCGDVHHILSLISFYVVKSSNGKYRTLHDSAKQKISRRSQIHSKEKSDRLKRKKRRTKKAGRSLKRKILWPPNHRTALIHKNHAKRAKKSDRNENCLRSACT